MTKQQILIISAICGCIFGGIAGTLSVTRQQTQRQAHMVAALCDWSLNGDTDSERALCSQLQKATNTEYLCNNDFNCWAEIK